MSIRLKTKLTIATLCRYLASFVELTINCPWANSSDGFVLYFHVGIVGCTLFLYHSISHLVLIASQIVCVVYYKTLIYLTLSKNRLLVPIAEIRLARAGIRIQRIKAACPDHNRLPFQTILCCARIAAAIPSTEVSEAMIGFPSQLRTRAAAVTSPMQTHFTWLGTTACCARNILTHLCLCLSLLYFF